jgi:hypothetical protein
MTKRMSPEDSRVLVLKRADQAPMPSPTASTADRVDREGKKLFNLRLLASGAQIRSPVHGRAF